MKQPKPSNCKERIALWAVRIRIISDEMVRLKMEQARFKALDDAFRHRGELRADSPFWTFQLWYTSYAVMSIRRQFDDEANHVCIGSLIADILKNPTCIAPAHFASLSPSIADAPPGWTEAELARRATGWLKDDRSLDVATIEDEYDVLKKQANVFLRFASSTIAHLHSKNLGDNFGLTFGDLDALILALDSVVIRYENMLTREGATRLPLHSDHPWVEAVASPWWQDMVPAKGAGGSEDII